MSPTDYQGTVGVEQHAWYRGQDARRGQRNTATRVEDAGIAVGAATSRVIAIDDGDRKAVALQSQCRADADDTGTQNGDARRHVVDFNSKYTVVGCNIDARGCEVSVTVGAIKHFAHHGCGVKRAVIQHDLSQRARVPWVLSRASDRASKAHGDRRSELIELCVWQRALIAVLISQSEKHVIPAGQQPVIRAEAGQALGARSSCIAENPTPA